MTPEIERLAKKVGIDTSGSLWRSGGEDGVHMDDIAKLIRVAAEECAKECEGEEDRGYKIAAAIRAKFALSHKTPEAK